MYNGKSPQLSSNCKELRRGEILPYVLYDLLAQATPHGYEHLIYPVIMPYIRKYARTFIRDKKGNLFAWVAPEDIKLTSLTTMFSCHIDTAHRLWGINLPPLINPVMMDTDSTEKDSNYAYGMIYGTERVMHEGKIILKPSPLGADDKIGAFILTQLLEQKIPAVYAFHVGEECGCVGSSFSSEAMKVTFKNITKCIAFDRMNYGDVIAHQRGRRCASEAFTNKLADALNAGLPKNLSTKFSGNVNGMYTDSANYDGYISECTNISVGYWGQHGDTEHFDFVWLRDFLLPTIKQVKWNDLETSRNPNKKYETQIYSYNRQKTIESKQLTLQDVACINYSTPLDKVPKWKPQDGRIQGISDVAMKRLVTAYIIRTFLKNSWGMTTITDDYIAFIKQMETENQKLIDKLIKAKSEIEELSSKLAGLGTKKEDVGTKELTGKQIRRLTRITKMCENVISRLPEEALKKNIQLPQKERLDLMLKNIMCNMVGQGCITRNHYQIIMEFASRLYFFTRNPLVAKERGMNSLSNKLKNTLEN